VDSKKIEFNFNTKGEKGLKAIIYAKGIMLSSMCFFLILLFLPFILFLLPFKKEVGIYIFRIIIILGCSFILYLFSKSLIEIHIEDNCIQFRTFKKYRKLTFERIRLIKIYYFTTWGTSTIIVKAAGESFRYYLWVPRHERERHELFLQFVETLKEKAEGRFEFRYKT